MLKELQEGIAIDTGGKIRMVHFVLGLIVGDNLSPNSVLGSAVIKCFKLL